MIQGIRQSFALVLIAERRVLREDGTIENFEAMDKRDLNSLAKCIDTAVGTRHAG